MIHIAEPSLGDDEMRNVIEAVETNWISSKGKFVSEFEDKFAQFCGVKYGVAVSNGTVALHLAIEALGIGANDEIIVPTLTFIATVNAVTHAGAKPVFVDSHPEYWCIDPGKIEQVINKKTKAIIPVHLYGHPCDMDSIMEIAKRHNLYVIEDAAEAHGAEYKERKVGSFGDINCFSFYANKIITTGEGGMCLTNNEHLAEKMRSLRSHGINPHKAYWFDLIGFNFRMTNLQAAIGVAQMKKLVSFIERKREIAATYNFMLRNASGLVLPTEMPWAKNVYWMYSLLIENGFGLNKDKLTDRLSKAGIETRPLFYPVHLMPPYNSDTKFPVAEELSRKGLNLPSGVTLKRSDIRHIVYMLAKE